MDKTFQVQGMKGLVLVNEGQYSRAQDAVASTGAQNWRLYLSDPPKNLGTILAAQLPETASQHSTVTMFAQAPCLAAATATPVHVSFFTVATKSLEPNLNLKSYFRASVTRRRIMWGLHEILIQEKAARLYARSLGHSSDAFRIIGCSQDFGKRWVSIITNMMVLCPGNCGSGWNGAELQPSRMLLWCRLQDPKVDLIGYLDLHLFLYGPNSVIGLDNKSRKVDLRFVSAQGRGDVDKAPKLQSEKRPSCSRKWPTSTFYRASGPQKPHKYKDPTFRF